LAVTYALQTTSQWASRKDEPHDKTTYIKKYAKKQTYIGTKHCLLHYFGYA